MIVAHFHNDWDWTAIGTLALALGTVILAVLTWLSVKQGQSANATAQRELEEGRRPVVVPVANETEYIASLAMSSTADPMLPLPIQQGGGIQLPIRNIGVGPALELRIRGTVTEVKTGHVAHCIATRTLTLAAGSETPIGLTLAPSVSFMEKMQLRLAYRDVGKLWYETQAEYFFATKNMYILSVDRLALRREGRLARLWSRLVRWRKHDDGGETREVPEQAGANQPRPPEPS
jgi:hypothetical protein